MSDGAEPEATELDAQDPQELPPRITLKQTANFLGLCESSVRRYVTLGRLPTLSAVGKRFWFSAERVREFKAELLAQKARPRPPPATHDAPAAAIEQAREAARADKIVDIVSASNSHSEEFFRLAITSVNKLSETQLRLERFANERTDTLLKYYEKEGAKKDERIEKLETERAEWIELLEAQRRDAEAAADRRANREMLRETVNESKGIIKAIVASKLEGPAKMAMAASALETFVKTISPEQLDKISGALTPEQQAMLFSILAVVDKGEAPANGAAAA